MAIGTTAAILGSAALGAAGSIASSSAQKSAAKSAANASQAATDQSIAEQRRQFDIAQQNQAPWLTTGTSALNTIAGLYGLNTYQGMTPGSTGITPGMFNEQAYLAANPDVARSIAAGGFGGSGWNHYMEYGQNEGRQGVPQVSQVGTGQGAGQALTTGVSATPVPMDGNPNQQPFFASPDYQYRMNESMRALTARNSALGIQDSGAAQRSALLQAGNLASGEFNNYANRLASLAGVGQTAAQNTAALGSQMAGNIGNALTNNATNLASSYQNRANAQTGMYGSLANLGGNILGYYGGVR